VSNLLATERGAQDSPPLPALREIPAVVLLATAGERAPVVRQLLPSLFPRCAHYFGGPHYGDGFEREWGKRRRVAVEEVLRFYLEHRLPEGAVATTDVERAYELLGDRAALSGLFDSLEPSAVETLLRRLEAFEDEYPVACIEPAIGAVLDQMPRLREGTTHMFDVGADMAVERLVLRLLRRVENASDREALVDRVLPTVNRMSAQRHLIHIAGSHKLAEANAVERWTAILHAGLAGASPEALAAERDLGPLLEGAIRADPTYADAARRRLVDGRVFSRFLACALQVQRRAPLGGGAVHSEDRLPWQGLCKLIGGEWLRARVKKMAVEAEGEQLDSRAQRALAVAVRYADGWAPKDWFEAEPVGEVAPANNDSDESASMDGSQI
jgi:hypothetical protein